ncbi:MAG: hypothetical protein DHS20C14_21390 [Phycisphaeraceae bacterium]|nr:MAG: hypothetical protein DHS20C14_21390 [Phycisphaeraceae bacterium]
MTVDEFRAEQEWLGASYGTEYELPPNWPEAKWRLRTNFAAAGTGGLILWPVFGATNQLLGGLALLVLTVWLVRKGRPPWVTAVPMVFMLAMTGWAIVELARTFVGGPDGGGRPGLLAISVVMLAMEVWIVIEAGVLVVRGSRSGGLAGGSSGG